MDEIGLQERVTLKVTRSDNSCGETTLRDETMGLDREEFEQLLFKLREAINKKKRENMI